MSSDSKDQVTQAPPDIFATTRWTVVVAAGGVRAPQTDLALEELCKIYWYPLYAYVRRQGHGLEDAEDLTQAFFARFLEKNYIEGLSSDKGKFRSFLLASLKNFLANEWDRNKRLKRGGGAIPLSMDLQEGDTRYVVLPADNLSPDKIYDRAWAITLLERVLARLRDESDADGKSQLFDQLKPFLTAGKNAPYAIASSTLNMSEGSIRVTVHRLRKRYRELLKDEISQTLTDPTQADEEMRALFEAFS
jgi:RNA polymerase sigma factor (sigma-70 family)